MIARLMRGVRLLSLFALCLLVTRPLFAQTFRENLEQLRDETVPVLEQQRVDAESRATAAGLPLRVQLATGEVAELQFYIGNRPVYYITDNVVAADTVSTDEVQPGGSSNLSLDGATETLGIWDGGNVRDTHQEFGGRVTNNNAAGLSDHATHVSGTMIAAGVTATARGMSFGASLRGWDFNNDVAEMIDEQLAAIPVIVSNHSYSFITGWIFNFFGDGLWVWFGDVAISTQEDWGFGFYSSNSRNVDQLAYDSPNYVVVRSAGNDRNDGGPAPGSLHHHVSSGSFVTSTDVHPGDGGPSGYDTIAGGFGSSKNVFTIGAVNDIPGGYTGPADVVMSSFSGWGPTDDGRIKPDLVANGVGLFSSFAGSDTSYGVFSGTSMSAPNTAGSLGLLRQHARSLLGGPLTSATIRALAIHSADDAGNVGPDYSFGWGLLNTETAASVMTEASLGLPTSEIHELILANNSPQSLFFNANASTGTIRVTAVWTDPAGTVPPNGLDPATPILVNDLDIRLVDPNTTTHMPWLLDPANPATAATIGDNFRDPIEQIVVSPPVVGTYRIDITHKGTLQGGVAQPVSVIISTGDAVNQPPAVDAGPDQSVTLPSAASLDGAVTDDGLPTGNLTTLWTQTSGPGTTSFANASAEDTTATFSTAGVYVLRLMADDGEFSIFDEVMITVNAAPSNLPPAVDAGPDLLVTLPSVASLDGTVTDDGLPTGNLTTLWTQTSGPGTTSFANTSTVDTTAAFSTAGVYVLRLTADDGEFSTFDEVMITVSAAPPNLPPVVDAGPDLLVTLPSAASLDGTVTDDGLPTGNLTILWTQTSGPGTTSFANASAEDTTATFSTAGVYVLRLTADDTQATTFDELTVTVDVAVKKSSIEGDRDGDGKSDILWRNPTTGQNWLFLMDGSTVVGSSSVLTTQPTLEIAGSGDYDGDGKSDILWRNPTTGQNWLFLMDGSTVVGSSGVPTTLPILEVAGSGDYDGDGKSDILWRNPTTGQNWLFLMDGSTVVGSSGVPTTLPILEVAGSGDYDGDGKSDILWRNPTTGQNWLFLMDGSTVVGSSGVPTTLPILEVAGSGDYDGDGKSDILWRNPTTGQNWLFLMDGSTVVGSSGVPTTLPILEVAGSGDYDGDGKSDILWRNPTTGQNWMFLMDGSTVVGSSGVPTTLPIWEVAGSGN